MFCILLQTDAGKDSATVEIVHNDNTFSCSKDLCIKNSKIFEDMIKKGTPINIDYERDDDDFQLIVDLFNYKRVFITHTNIDFLEFAGNEFQIPKLIKKAKKYRNQYEDIIENCNFKELITLHNQMFSILNAIPNKKTDDNETPNKNEEGNDNEDFHFDISEIKYNPEYSSTISHLIFGLCLAKPLYIPQYMKTVESNPTLRKHFEDFLDDDVLANMFCNILRACLKIPEKQDTTDMEVVKYNDNIIPTSKYDTGLINYLEKITNYIADMNSDFSRFKSYVQAIKIDDVDTLQQLLNSNQKIYNDQRSYKTLMNLSSAYSAVKCVKFFILNFQSQFGRPLKIESNDVTASIIGGNLEIFHLLLEKYKGSRDIFIKDSILFHKNKIMKWIIENYAQFLSIYNTCCTRVLYDKRFIPQRNYMCNKCHYEDECCCTYCAKHCHVKKHDGKDHDVKYLVFSRLMFCDDDCKLSQNMKPECNKKFVEIDDLVLLSVYCANFNALKILIKNGANIPKCRDNPTRSQYSKMDQQLIKLLKEMRGFNENKFMPKSSYKTSKMPKEGEIQFVDDHGFGIELDGSKNNHRSFGDFRTIRQKEADGDIVVNRNRDQILNEVDNLNEQNRDNAYNPFSFSVPNDANKSHSSNLFSLSVPNDANKDHSINPFNFSVPNDANKDHSINPFNFSVPNDANKDHSINPFNFSVPNDANNDFNDKNSQQMINLAKDKKVDENELKAKITQNEFITFNKANQKYIEHIATERNMQELIEKITYFGKYLNIVKTKMDESIEFASLAATEELLFTLNDSNIANYKYAARVIISSPQIELSLKQFLSAFINACIYRHKYFNIYIDLIKDIKSPRLIETLESMKTAENNKRNFCIQKVISFINESSNPIEQNEALKTALINDDLLLLQNILEGKINISNVHLNLSQNEKQLLVKDSNEPTLLEYAAFYGSERCFNYLCSFDKSQMRNTIGRFAVCGGNLNIIKTVIDSGICLKNDVKFAIKFHHFDAFKQLFSLYFEFDNNAYNEVQNNFCLLCIKFFSIRILRFLIEFGADINDCLVHEALSNNVHSLFMFLMQFNVDLNQRNKKGQTALDCANVSKNKYASQIVLNKLK